MIANNTPGRPTTTNATRQLMFCAIHPPLTAPSIAPSGMPKEKIESAVARALAG
jgi:hypothetical protein